MSKNKIFYCITDEKENGRNIETYHFFFANVATTLKTEFTMDISDFFTTL